MEYAQCFGGIIMDKAFVDYLVESFAALCFVGLLIVAIKSLNTASNSIVTLKNAEESSTKVFYEHKNTITQDSISRQDLISRLMQNLNYTIYINGYCITPDQYHYINYDYTSIPNGDYRITYDYDTQGNLVSIHYDNI